MVYGLDCGFGGTVQFVCRNTRASPQMCTRKRERNWRSLFLHIGLTDYTQAITPPVMLHVFADCECVAVALHSGGGPARLTATIVTFCDGVNP